MRATTARLKESKQALGAEVLAAVSEWTPPTLLVARGPPEHARAALQPGRDQRARAADPALSARRASSASATRCWRCSPNQALGVALFSYAGKLCWGFNADWDLVPDLHDFVTDIEASFAELQQAADASPRQGERRVNARNR